MSREKQARELVGMKRKYKYWLWAFGAECGHWEALDLITEGHTRRCKDEKYERLLEPSLVHGDGVQPRGL